ncbi:MAG: homoserine dehydrogenase [Lachnospiraceae bacterium]|nr:homoserine dehydrogenase [Lachnospiraceae bacterium]
MLKIAILGFGTVGQGVADVIDMNREKLTALLSDEIEIAYILDLREFPEHPLGNKVVHDIAPILSDPEVKVVCEMMGGVHPASDFTKAALLAGKNVVTSNKAVVADCGPELLALAREKKVRYLFEASVGGGIPILRPLTGDALAGNEITAIEGILNGTTNYILTEMRDKGTSFEDALATAKKLGYAEADPTADVEGYDACRKICILAAVAFGVLIPFEKVECEGITRVTAGDVKNANASGASVKLIGRAVKHADGTVALSVSPCAVLGSNPLSHIDDVFNGIAVHGNAVGDLLFYGRGAGKLPTASAVVSDIVDILRCGDKQPAQTLWNRDESLLVPFTEEDEKLFASTVGTPLKHPLPV